ncbi:hypothetical protein RSSM_00878 [Rhodopirellula sallentina SM41]|uniref:Uncharacterized protein n=1 Tax=Rhodopirellula sallentina SM41 TaxID=1263870 RepID=M5U8A1_9BACT|nr:hypothetical protein RSSM_00878 [Rhodopirellula sallentina SM41]
MTDGLVDELRSLARRAKMTEKAMSTAESQAAQSQTDPPQTDGTPNTRYEINIGSLLAEFYASTSTLALFEEVEQCPPPFDQLLDHHSHMTVTVEAFHKDEVDVVVHRSRSVLDDGESVWQNDPLMKTDARLAIAERTVTYTREITLVTHNTGKVVQYGLVRLDPSALGRDVWMEIASGEIPLGRVLIKHNVLRSVERYQLWKVTPGVALSSLLQTAPGEIVYGRTALIRCNDQPAIELIEIVK